MPFGETQLENLAKWSWIREGISALGLQVRRHQPPTCEKRFCCGQAGDTDVVANIEVKDWYIGRLRQRGPGTDLSLNRGRVCACGQQDCPQHHGRVLINQRHSDCLCFDIRNTSYNAFLLRPSGRVSSSLIAAAFLRGVMTLTDELPVKVLRVSQVSRTIWPSLRLVCCLNQSQQSKSRRSDVNVSCQVSRSPM